MYMPDARECTLPSQIVPMRGAFRSGMGSQCLLIADSSQPLFSFQTMLRQIARSGRVLRLCQAAAASRVAPCTAESCVGPDLTASRAFGALTQPFAMCDISKAPPKQHVAPASKPAAPHRPAAAQDAKKRAFTTLEEEEDDGAYGVMYPQPIANIGKPAPAFTSEGILWCKCIDITSVPHSPLMLCPQ